MAENRKFAALAGLRQQPSELREGSTAVITSSPQGSKGRPRGKRSNPEFQPTTVILRKQTKKLANRKLEDLEKGQDLSELIEHLLSKWIHNPDL